MSKGLIQIHVDSLSDALKLIYPDEDGERYILNSLHQAIPTPSMMPQKVQDLFLILYSEIVYP